MGYPVRRYRDSAGRAERQLSREQPPPQPSSPANDNYKPPLKPANDNYPPRLPPQTDKLVKRPALKKAAQAAMQIHPLLRILSTLWKLYDMYDWIKRTKIDYHGWTIACDVGLFGACIPDGNPDPCTGFKYCMGPSFSFGINNPSLCGISGQAGYGGMGYFPGNIYYDGVITWAHRGLSSPPALCHPGSMRTQWRNGNYQNRNGEVRVPQAVPWVRTTPPPWAPHRWYKPMPLLKPQVDYDVPPVPPPYPMIPPRNADDMWPGTRSYASPDAAPRQAYAYAYRSAPPRNTREQKVKWSGPAQILHAVLVSIGKVHGKLADLRDILGAMEESLPKELRLKGKDKRIIQKQLENLFRHWDKMNGEQALLGIIKELAEDVVGGTGDMFRKEAAKNFGWLKNKVYVSPRF